MKIVLRHDAGVLRLALKVLDGLRCDIEIGSASHP